MLWTLRPGTPCTKDSSRLGGRRRLGQEAINTKLIGGGGVRTLRFVYAYIGLDRISMALESTMAWSSRGGAVNYSLGLPFYHRPQQLGARNDENILKCCPLP